MNSSKDIGIITALLERLEKQRLPRLIAIKDRVDRGERLGDADLKFMQEVISDTSRIKPLLQDKPAYQPLVDRLLNLYSSISEKALLNEKESEQTG